MIYQKVSGSACWILSSMTNLQTISGICMRFICSTHSLNASTNKSLNYFQAYRSNINNSANTTSAPLAQEIRSFLQTKNLNAQSGPTCFKCENVFPKPKVIGRPRKSATSNQTLFINKTTGDFFCVDSGHSGSWNDFRDYMKNPLLTRSSLDFDTKSSEEISDSEGLKKIWEDSVSLSECADLTCEETLCKFGLDVITLSDLESYDIRFNKNLDTVIVPWFSNLISTRNSKQESRGTPIGLKTFSLSNGSEPCEVSRLPRKGYYNMLGIEQVPVNSKKIVLTMNEFDAIAVNFASTQYKAISLPSGNTYLPLQVLPYLEQFSEIIIWFNNNQVSWEAGRQFSKKLGENRCRIVRPTAGTPNPLQALSKNLDLDGIISSAVSAEIKNIVSFIDLRGFVKDELMNCDTVCGVPWTRFTKLTEKLKGHRRGELTVITGPTGSGKTTFMSEYSLDLAMQGVSTLWGSFEVQNVRLLKTMMKQFARRKLENEMSDFEHISDKFQSVPIHLMTYNGPQSMKDVIHTMRQAAYVHDIQHIVIDNLQFMMGAMQKNNDRFMVQDMLISEFRNFATTEHIHVTLVIHPRKEDPSIPLQISSIFGTAKATQEADNVLILQQVRSVKDGNAYKKSYIELVKNRYDGELGTVALYFDKSNLCMSKPITDNKCGIGLKLELDENEVQLNGGGIYSQSEKPISDEVLDTPEWITNLEQGK